MLRIINLRQRNHLTNVLKIRISNASYSSAKTTYTTEDEISHFKDLAPSWWDTDGSQRILHKMNLARLDFIQRNLRNSIKIKNPDVFIPGYNYKEFFPTGVSNQVKKEWNHNVDIELNKRLLNVLDIGCGGGILAESMGRLPFVNKVIGIDLTEDCITVAKQHAKLDPILEGKVEYRLEALEDVKGSYDVITCFEMLEHVDRPDEILRSAWDRLKPDGILFLSTINRDLISWFTTIFIAEKVVGLVPNGTHHLKKFINSSEVMEWFQKKKPKRFQIIDLKGTMYIPTQGWVEHNCTDIGNYFMAVKKLK